MSPRRGTTHAGFASSRKHARAGRERAPFATKGKLPQGPGFSSPRPAASKAEGEIMYSVLLEVVISLAGVYLLFALFCSSVWEAWSQWRGKRGILLRERVREILGGGALFEQVYRHPLLTSLGPLPDTKKGPVARAVFDLVF